MWEKFKQSISSGTFSTNIQAGRDVIFYNVGNIPTKFVDQAIGEEISRLRQVRLFPEFTKTKSSLTLGKSLIEGELSAGSNEVKGQALAWCARILSYTEECDRADDFLKHVNQLGDFPEAIIAEAFIISNKGDKSEALRLIAEIDSDSSRSASLIIVAHHHGSEGALNWMNNTGYAVEDLDSDGKFFLLNYQLQLARWDVIKQTLDGVSDSDYQQTPILHHLAALISLVPAVPEELRTRILAQVPFDVRNFPLASDADALKARRNAHRHFLDSVEAAKQLSCSQTERVAEEYVLWLELRDPVHREEGLSRLENLLNSHNSALRFVHYADQFRIKLDQNAVDKRIEQDIARNAGKTTIDVALARLALSNAQPTPEKAAEYISRYQNQLDAHIDAKFIRCRKIELLARAGLIYKANDELEKLLEDGIPTDQENILRMIISKTRGNDSIESCKERFNKTKTLDDLIILVAELEDNQYWDDLCKFSKILFEKTHSLRDAERLVEAFNRTHKSEELVRFLNENTDLLPQSNLLRMSFAWGLFHEGQFLKSRTALKELKDEEGSENYRALQVNLWIATGDWASLTVFTTEVYQYRKERNAQELISAARLSQQIGSPHAKDLLFEAAIKGNDDPEILVNAYSIATSAGWENNHEVYKWFERAIELSGDEGPIQRMSLKDVFDQKPDWDRQESETWQLLAHSQIPIFFAAKSLNKTLIDLTAFPALSNLTETDPRRRSAIHAFSGKRLPFKFGVKGKTIALDPTALLTLSFLNILNVVLDAFEKVYIPHSTLGWLFEESLKTNFHQPSRIENAHKVRDLLAREILEKFTPSTVASSELSSHIGIELAVLIAEAEKISDGENIQRIVVRSSPVHRVSSLMEEEADLSSHDAVLSSCQAVVEKMRQKGQLTEDEEKHARTYLQLHEKAWPNQPVINDGAILYLDDLSIHYFLHLDLLERINAAGMTAVISPRGLSEVNALISYERISGDVKNIIERIRVSLNSRIESGHIRVSSRSSFDELESKTISGHPSVDILNLATCCDFAVIDDRFLNQHGFIENGDAKAPVCSTLNLLESLVSAGIISKEENFNHQTQLRCAGYIFVPVSLEELERYLGESNIEKEKVLESAELRVIRESILRIRMSDFLRFPEEISWLDNTLNTLVIVLRNQWKDGADIEEATVRSNWLANQIDVRGWAHCLNPEVADNFIRVGRAAHLLKLLLPLVDVQESILNAYWKWVQKTILYPIKEQFPEVYEWLISWSSNHIIDMVETLESEEDNS